MDALLDAYRSGGGVGWDQLGTDAREAQAAANRPLFLGALPRDYLPSVPEINQVLARGGRVADVGCGFGWSAIGLALAHPGRSPWTATTWTPRPSRRPGATRWRPGWPTGCASTWPTRPA